MHIFVNFFAAAEEGIFLFSNFCIERHTSSHWSYRVSAIKSQPNCLSDYWLARNVNNTFVVVYMLRQTATVLRIEIARQKKKEEEKKEKKQQQRKREKRISLIFYFTTLADCGQRI